MTLSVVIVNYNVKYFIKQCLTSVFASNLSLSDGSKMNLDVWVVDNDSVDGSVQMLQQDFPQVNIIANTTNVGFAKANNQALKQVQGDVVLLLNPDTIVENDTLVKSVEFVLSHEDCGGLTVKMIDGQGTYLRESKRGFPTPWAAMCKMIGLTRLFPHSKHFASYYMGHLSETEINAIDILPGAYIMFRKAVYQQIGGLDESYFMYGEDIDFSWRIRLAGYKNYYLPEPHIVHYKGESTKKGSMNYVYTFYNAMSIFVKRYFTKGKARLFSVLLHLAIWFRATLSWLSRVVRRLIVPAIDFVLAYGGFLLIKHLWADIWANNIDYYPAIYSYCVIPIYILILMACSFMAGGYDKPVKMGKIVKGMGVALLLLLVFYSLLNEQQRYSRMLLILGSLWTCVATMVVRLLLSLFKVKGYDLRRNKKRNSLIVGDDSEVARITSLYKELDNQNILFSTPYLDVAHMRDIIRINHIDEVVFCGNNASMEQIIGLMIGLNRVGVEYQIAPKDGDYVIGSSSIMANDDTYVATLDVITSPESRRRKRVFDIIVVFFMIILSPIIVWFVEAPSRLLRHSFDVASGKLSWVGYPACKGVFMPYEDGRVHSSRMKEKIMERYIQHYRETWDLQIIFKNWRRL